MPKSVTDRREVVLYRLHDYAVKYKGDAYAAEVLMSFIRGECMHMPDKHGKCELCGAKGVSN